ncbi:dihydrofolate reductase family protein [Janthinobacterium agaricidamnosum]|uniref:RibD C-terminal domain protein n=1 Tax=Janthinobacterium agaricidamnosum NBRC 102515 = DSM 9628 TaxID=1349767 RepID=W0V0H3_9BURK|nr:dihydrofolate reductase family protein [Janthinobacterium agaricidamnosum]CDG81371.1 ribD C-terminal domain protein [Janthinobacterium agaricidamnosum NBRC 102515 = DSM 9628]
MHQLKVSVFSGISLDGYLAGTDGDLSWLSAVATDPPEDTGYQALLDDIDVLVMGRNTYDAVLRFASWPYHGKQVVVLTHRPLQARHGETAHDGALADLLAALRQAGRRHVYLDGGAAVRQGLAGGLVDTLTLNWLPVILGKGIPLFATDLSMSNWRLQHAHAYPSGLLQSRYSPLPP